jgi:hypothetical protein
MWFAEASRGRVKEDPDEVINETICLSSDVGRDANGQGSSWSEGDVLWVLLGLGSDWLIGTV